MKRRREGGDKDGRAYASAAMRVTAHPTRETILRTLEEKPRSTVELEKITGESRYNLYHHLAILERLNLIGHRVDEGRTKEFFLTRTRRPDVGYLLLDEKNLEERDVLREVVALLERRLPGRLPNASKIRRCKMLFLYPWSKEE